MNILEHYDKSLITLREPETTDNENYYCNIHYNNMPFMIKTNCLCSSYKDIIDNQVCVSITNQAYALWIESFYRDCIELTYKRSHDWFDDDLTINDIENSFMSPLKSNIKMGCHDVVCSLEESTEVNNINGNNNIIPTILINGIKFNSKHFQLDLILKSVMLEDPPQNPCAVNTSIIDTNISDNSSGGLSDLKTLLKEVSNVPLEEVHIKSKDIPAPLEEIMEVPLEEIIGDVDMDNVAINDNNMSNIYNILNTKINDDVVEHLKLMLLKKKVKINFDLNELYEDDYDSDND